MTEKEVIDKLASHPEVVGRLLSRFGYPSIHDPHVFAMAYREHGDDFVTEVYREVGFGGGMNFTDKGIVADDTQNTGWNALKGIFSTWLLKLNEFDQGILNQGSVSTPEEPKPAKEEKDLGGYLNLIAVGGLVLVVLVVILVALRH